MRNFFNFLILAGLLLTWGSALTTPAQAADETAQVLMLREVFRAEQPEWPKMLEQYRGLLDDTFFQRCEARIKWALENYQVQDAFRFSAVADMAAKLTSRPAIYRTELAEIFYRNKNFTMFEDLLNNILLTDPDNQQALYMKASYLHDTGSVADAYLIYEQLAAKGFQAAECNYRMALIDSLIGDADKARKHVEACLAADPNHQNARVLQQRLAPGQLKFVPDSATAPGTPGPPAPGASLNNHSPEAEAAFAQAEKLLADGDLKTAETFYLQAIQKNPGHTQAIKYAGALYYRERVLDRAVQFLSEATRQDPGDLEAQHFLGNTYERLYDVAQDRANLEKAVQAYQKAAELDPANKMVQGELLRAQQKLGVPAAGPTP